MGKYEIGSEVFGHWVIKRLIGEGSFGKVYEIERENFGTYRAALKVITIPSNSVEVKNAREEGMDEKSIQIYFYSVVEDIVREFALMSRLKGMTNIVSYEDHEVVAHEDGIGWDILIRMELLTPLLAYAYAHPMSRRDIIKIGIDMCNALELCQKYNIIHRDIKPENMFVSDNGDYKLGDFGIARTVEKTSSGLSKKGTYSYMAPEVYRGLPYGFSVDIYSLGILLYRLLNANRTPFLPPAPAPITYTAREEALERRMRGDAIELPLYGQGRLGEIVLKACAYEPKERYSSPMEMRQELEAILYNEQDAAIIYPSGDQITLVKNDYVSSSGERKDSKSRDENKEEDEDKTEFAGAVHISAEVTGAPAGTGAQNQGRDGNARKSGNDEKGSKSGSRKWIPILGGVLGFCILLSAGLVWMIRKRQNSDEFLNAANTALREEEDTSAGKAETNTESKPAESEEAATSAEETSLAETKTQEPEASLPQQRAEGDYRVYDTRWEIAAKNRQPKEQVQVGVMASRDGSHYLELPEYAGQNVLMMEDCMKQAGLKTWNDMWYELQNWQVRQIEDYFETAMTALDKMLEENDVVFITGYWLDALLSPYGMESDVTYCLDRVRKILAAYPDKELLAGYNSAIVREFQVMENVLPDNLTELMGMDSYDEVNMEMMYLAGIAAGKCTQSGKAGILIDESWSVYDAEVFRLGMKENREEAELYLYGESFWNVDEQETIRNYAQAGCDVVAGYALSPEACSLAEELGVKTISLADYMDHNYYADIILGRNLAFENIAEKAAECIRSGFVMADYINTVSNLMVSAELSEEVGNAVLQAQRDYDEFYMTYWYDTSFAQEQMKAVPVRTLCMPDPPETGFFLPKKIGENYFVNDTRDYNNSPEEFMLSTGGHYYNISRDEYKDFLTYIEEATGSKGQESVGSGYAFYELEFVKNKIQFKAEVNYEMDAQVITVSWYSEGYAN